MQRQIAVIESYLWEDKNKRLRS
ncbi:hypothetical protein YERSI8AC_810017 [Enterobacterales bacterium 8AC]|nr:hypothetical protein YERSI8AC_810017 [Enterobacterales bacterium 8AC]